MVKKFISGILGKGEAKGAVSEDVPDELPPLAEDVIGKIQEPKKEAKAEEPAARTEKEDVPDELPPLDEGIAQSKSDESAGIGTIADLETELLPDEIKKAKLAKLTSQEIKDGASNAEYAPLKKAGYAATTASEQMKGVAEIGFFSNVLEHIKRHGGAKERLLVGDLFSRMDNYWQIRKHEIKTGAALPAEKRLDEELMKKLEELKALEQKWHVQRLALEEDLRFIHEREREIQAKINELRLISNELGLFRTVKPEEYFHMHNGVVLKSLHELIDILEVIDEGTFDYHVGKGKNDFSEWVRDVFKDSSLADKIRNAKTKVEMIEILETVPVAGSEAERASSFAIAKPKKYFWLANGTVIRSLYELSDALKAMDDELFKTHVNEQKNDFANWARDALGNVHLAEKLNNAKAKKDMAELIEAFL